MRSLQLQTALTEFIESAAGYLQAQVLAGAEVEFEIEQHGSRRGTSGPGLYCYRPLTADFIAERAGQLQRLPSYGEAARLLSSFDGLERYLVGAGEDVSSPAGRSDVGAAIGALLCDVFGEQTDFKLRPERVREALGRLDRAATEGAGEVMIIATLHGVAITSPELALAKGLTIAQPHALGGLPPGALPRGGQHGAAHLVVALSLPEQEPSIAFERGRDVLMELVRALRLFGDGRVSLGALAWGRVGGGGWSPMAIPAGGRPHGILVVTAEQEDELRAFCSLVSRRAPDGNALAWALRRFELGCERDSAMEGLTDHLLALRALLEPEGPDSGLLPERLAAVCAVQGERTQFTERFIAALALERELAAGAPEGGSTANALAAEVADSLRALLRDLICGHLEGDLVAIAEELLARERAPQAALEADAPHAMELLASAFPAPAGQSAEQLFGDPGQAQEILDVFI